MFNLQRLAVLTTALGQTPPDAGLIYEAMKDRMHEPYRRKLIPGLMEVTNAITPDRYRGLLGICLSGAGPTILALATGGYREIGEEAKRIFGLSNVEVDWQVLTVAGGSVIDREDGSRWLP